MADEAEREAARLLSQVDQIQAVIVQSGAAFGQMHTRLLEEGVPRRLAGQIAADAAHQWFAGTFNKPPSIKFPGLT